MWSNAVAETGQQHAGIDSKTGVISAIAADATESGAGS
jgi:hypothetical protein